MTRNLKVFAGAVVIFYVIGAVNESVGMYVLSAAALGVILAAYFLTRLLIRGVEAQLEPGGARTQAGKPLAATVRVRNAGRITRTGMTLEVGVRNETVPEGSGEQHILLPPLPPRSLVELEVLLECRARGLHRLNALRMVAHDPVGVYHRGRDFAQNASFLGLPRTCEAPGISSWELLSPEGRRAARLLRRSGGDFEGIRAHVPGDDLRHVHWKVTAHTGELVVKHQRRRREAEIAVWLDLWEGNHALSGPDSPTEVAVSLAATLLDIFVRGDYMVSLAGHGLSPDLALPSRGEAYLDRALVALAEARPAPGPGFADFCADRLVHSPRLHNVFAVTPAAEPGLADVLAAAARRGAHPVAFLTGALDPGAGADIAARLTLAEHEDTLTRLRATGVDAVRVATFEDIPRAITGVAGTAAVGA